jgi:hypothetical protein
MRSRLLLPLLTFAAVLAVGVIWQRERAAAQALQVRFAALAEQEQRLAQLQAERGRLQREIEEAARFIPAEPMTPAPEPAPVASPAPRTWTVGEWTPSTAWRNAGSFTPQATTTTLLWAAANGDTATMREVFQFGADTRAKARAWFDSLPPAARAAYDTPEDLVAGVTLARISPERAQLSWLNETNAERAIVGLLVSRPDAATSATSPAIKPATGNLPPALEERAHYSVVVLNLQRTPDGWRVQVPADAIDGLTRSLRAAPRSGSAQR